LPTPLDLPDVDVPELEFAGLKAQYEAIKDDLGPRLARVFEHGRFIMGPEVAELEAALAAHAGCDHAVAVSSGTDALLAVLLAWGVGPGDAVFVPAFTFTATAEVVALIGAHPVFVDVDPRNFTIDPLDLAPRVERVRARHGLRPRTVIAVDLFGLPADYDSLDALCRREGLYLLADAAQSFGASRDGRRVGALAAATATSFFPPKPLGCYGDGGAVLTDDEELDGLLRSIREHGQGATKYEIERLGLNARLDSLQAAVLLSKLPLLEGEIAARTRLAELYDAELATLVETPLRPPGHTSAWAQYSILTERRDELRAALEGDGIPTAIHYPAPLHLQPAYARFGDGPGSLPVSESLCGRILSLPMHGYMKESAARRVTDAVRRALAGR
jgi:dTDP-4-amino-4,6-dideoxygalactose transaminase